MRNYESLSCIALPMPSSPSPPGQLLTLLDPPGPTPRLDAEVPEFWNLGYGVPGSGALSSVEIWSPGSRVRDW
eukprot:CAMPEP_0184293836 /NCGR_PEP_ID=MMETSP1049-20130417/5170_1 /TAXON_ID=77928 /ORGANISM="Proteomonas sulcata, Strain CCMP704" /LENGTH=72 /DNA_ID=CAMNT_0026601919 /DNA_START=1 /DNA_END=216 /DNA_ORIENTATION=+